MLRTLLKISPPYDEAMLEQVMAALKGMAEGFGGAEFELEEDPSILGGFIAYIGDTILDASVQKQLSEMRGMIRRD
jgi:F0F1-type ATP synthase delta subunit